MILKRSAFTFALTSACVLYVLTCSHLCGSISSVADEATMGSKRKSTSLGEEPVVRRSWEQPASSSWRAGGCGGRDLQSQASAGESLVEHLLSLYANAKLSAKDLCTTCYWCATAGARGDVAKYALAPGQSTGNYQKHLDSVMPLAPGPPDYYHLDAPTYKRRQTGRTSRKIPFVPFYESLAREWGATPFTQAQVLEGATDKEWGSTCNSSPVVQSAAEGEAVLPIALYLDNVRFTRALGPGRQDSLLAIYVYSLLSGKRVLVGVLRKSEMCRCGCRGWCSVYVTMLYLRWNFDALARGDRPLSQHDGSDWPRDSILGAMARIALGFKATLVELKGDWADCCHTLGFPPWNSKWHP